MVPSSHKTHKLSLTLPLPEFHGGWVWLVGAGLGEAGLLTLAAAHALRHADVVAHDGLIHPQVLALIPKATARLYVGKCRTQQHQATAWRQKDICAKLIALAQLGKRVVRLKGGDPTIFGRGGEEAVALANAGIPFRIIPGITAGIGAPQYMGIPITHRDINHAVTFVTGHASKNAALQLDWHAIAHGAPVIVLYMAVRHMGTIAKQLIKHGRNKHEPVAVIANASYDNQKQIITSLDRVEKDMALHQITPPAIIVVGQVVKLHHKTMQEDSTGGTKKKHQRGLL